MVAGASCFAALCAPLEAQLRRRAAEAPRVDGIHLGAAAISQRVRSLSIGGWNDAARLGASLSAAWGVHPRVALVGAWSEAAADFSGETYDIAHADLLFQYQARRGWVAYPYAEAGLSRVTWDATWDAPADYQFTEWMPTVGAGIKAPVGAGITLLSGVRLSRGNLRHQRVDGEVEPLTAVGTEGVRWMIGAQWQARPGLQPVTWRLGARPLSTRGLALGLGAMHAEGYDRDATWMGAGASFGASWGVTDRVSVLARYSRARPRRFDRDMDLRHRDLALRLAPRAQLHAARPYLELGGTTVEQRYRLFGAEIRDRGTMPYFGGGLLYALQRDVDVDLGFASTAGRMNDIAEGPRSRYRTFRLRMGLEYRPAR